MIGDMIQHADWQKEKHVPVIDCPDAVEADEFFEVTVSLGKKIAHPNTTEHHIRWIALYFRPKGENFPYEIGRFEFNAHGASVQGPNTSTVYTHHEIGVSMKTGKPGQLSSLALCNIHGLWEDTKEITLE